MKKGFLVAISLLSIYMSKAQNADFRNSVGLMIGANTFGVLNDIKGTTSPTAKLKYDGAAYSHSPTYQISWDYALAKWFSAGITGSYNNAIYNFENITYKNQNLGEVKLKAGRTTFGVRALFHYGNNDRWDFYSGFRLGVGLWSGRLSIDANDELADDLINSINENLSGYIPGFVKKRLENNLGARAGFFAPQGQFIPIGARYYFGRKIGANIELAVGSPYYLSGGLNYRF